MTQNLLAAIWKKTCECRLMRLGVLVFALVIHVALVFRHYPLGVFLRGEVPLKGDVGRYFATAYGAARSGGLFGYDPGCMAGYPVGLWNSMGKKGFEMLHLALPWVSLPSLFYVVIVGLCLVTPLAVWLILRGTCPTRRSSLVLFILCLAYWHLHTQISYFWGFGNIFFPATSCLLVAMVVLAGRALGEGCPVINSLLLGACAALAFYCHTVVLVAAVIPLLAVAVPERKRSGWRQCIVLSLSLVAFLVLAAWWLIPLLQTRQDCLSQPKKWFHGGPKHLVMDVFSDRAYLHHFDRNFLYHVAVVLGIAGMWLSWRDGRQGTGDGGRKTEDGTEDLTGRSQRSQRSHRVMAALGIGGIGALAITYGATYVGPLTPIQPYRFTIPAVILFLGPAAVCIDRGLTVLSQAGKACKVVVVLLLLIIAPEFTAYLIDLSWPPDACGVTESRRQVIEAVKDLPVEGRILCDDAGLGHILPYFCDVPVIGGLSSQAFLKHRFAGIDEEGILFGRTPQEWKADELSRYLQTYAVEYAVFSTPAWVKFAKKTSSPFEFVRTLGDQRLFKVKNARPGYALQGNASVKADHKAIHVNDAQSRKLVLKFHYADWLKADHDVRLEPVSVLDDPVPFIKATIPENVTAFTIAKP
jgi:hypothetical protein